jgi:mannose-6-phosphate isomerase-like protein (cupin superfamily)
MTIKDLGPEPQSFDLEKATLENSNYRAVAWSGKYLQLTLMSIPAGEDVGLEVHPQTDQFLRLDAGRGRVQMGPTKDHLVFDREVADGWAIFVPAGTWHNVTNLGDGPMQLYTVYAPVHHARARSKPQPPTRSGTRRRATMSRLAGRSSLPRNRRTRPDRSSRAPGSEPGRCSFGGQVLRDHSITHRRKSSGVTFPPHRTVATCLPSYRDRFSRTAATPRAADGSTTSPACS